MFQVLSTKEKEYRGVTGEPRRLVDSEGHHGWFSPIKVGEHPYRKNKDYLIPEILWVGRKDEKIPRGTEVIVKGKAKRGSIKDPSKRQKVEYHSGEKGQRNHKVLDPFKGFKTFSLWVENSDDIQLIRTKERERIEERSETNSHLPAQQ